MKEDSKMNIFKVKERFIVLKEWGIKKEHFIVQMDRSMKVGWNVNYMMVME